MSCIRCTEEDITLLLWFPSQSLNLTMKKCQTNSNEGDRPQRSGKARKEWGTVPDCRRLSRHDNYVKYGTLSWILEQNNNNSNNNNNIWIRSKVTRAASTLISWFWSLSYSYIRCEHLWKLGEVYGNCVLFMHLFFKSKTTVSSTIMHVLKCKLFLHD